MNDKSVYGLLPLNRSAKIRKSKEIHSNTFQGTISNIILCVTRVKTLFRSSLFSKNYKLITQSQ